MLYIKTPYINREVSKSRCYCDICVDSDCRTVWFEVDREYEKYLCTERSDAYLIGLLNWAMRKGHDITCEVPVTEELLYNINYYLIPTLSKYGKSLNLIKIHARVAPTIMEGNEVGTGLSCGVDSFSAIINNTNTMYKEHNITRLCINNVGAFNECYSEYGINKVKEERYVVSEKAANELQIPLVKTNSNFGYAFYQNHLLTHTYSSCFAIYMMQKMWKVYYYASSGYDYSTFTIIDNDNNSSARYELLSLQCFSTSGLKIYNEGGAKTRFQKIVEIIHDPYAQKYLHVCTSKPYNCSVCPKCKRTLVALDLLDALDSFSDVFDIEYYKKNRKDYYLWLYNQHQAGDLMNEPVYLEFIKRDDFNKVIQEATKKPSFKKRLKSKIRRTLRL